MPARSKITQLPPGIKAAFDKRLIDRGFSDYDEITAWLNAQLIGAGLEVSVSRSAAARYGQGFEEKIYALKIASEQARAITDALGDDADKMGQSLTALCQEQAFNVLVKMKDLDPENIDFNKLTVAISKLNKTAVDQKKWHAEVRKKATEAADDVAKVAKKEGLSEEKAEQIRKRILGIV